MRLLGNSLKDSFNRHINYIRLSVTDRCDFRCLYCMAEEMTFLPRNQVLSLEEMLTVSRCFVALGANKIRITGGEPLVRKNILWLMEELGQLSGLDQLVLTTNGSHLEKYAQDLKNAGVKRINVSMDSLDEKRFSKITRTGKLDQVLAGLDEAHRVGFKDT
ncbi:MAG: radical SAM protein, partial [Gammaproteobacteria bacterium]|nr:radical SAM protein [Gammaproteobacteria bacterium]